MRRARVCKLLGCATGSTTFYAQQHGAVLCKLAGVQLFCQLQLIARNMGFESIQIGHGEPVLVQRGNHAGATNEGNAMPSRREPPTQIATNGSGTQHNIVHTNKASNPSAGSKRRLRKYTRVGPGIAEVDTECRGSPG